MELFSVRKSQIINRKLNYRKVHGWLNSELICILALFFRGCNQPNLSTFSRGKDMYFFEWGSGVMDIFYFLRKGVLFCFEF